jgi:uncharacterized hydrophobic protein (TIGR00271 family)
MLNLAVYAPAELADRVESSLRPMEGVHRIIRLRGVVVERGEDLVGAGIEPEWGDLVVEELRRLGVADERIVLSRRGFDLVESRSRTGTGVWDAGGDAVVWEEVRDDALERATLSLTSLALIAVAGVIAAAGVFENQPVLIIGAMTVSPDLLTLSAACVGLATRSWRLTARSFVTLGVGLAVAAATGAIAIAIARSFGAAPKAAGFATGVLTGFVSQPSVAGAAIAALAGIAAILSFEASRAAISVGVAISVTTIPAAAGLGVATALGNGDRLVGSLAVLGINLTSLLVGGTATIVVQRWWRARRRERNAG